MRKRCTGTGVALWVDGAGPEISRVLRGLGQFGMARRAFLPEMIENFVGEIGQEEMREAAEPSLGLGCGDGIAYEVHGNSFAAVASDEDLLNGENAGGREAARMKANGGSRSSCASGFIVDI